MEQSLFVIKPWIGLQLSLSLAVFRREALYPCYGLAEATLFVAGGKKIGRTCCPNLPG